MADSKLFKAQKNHSGGENSSTDVFDIDFIGFKGPHTRSIIFRNIIVNTRNCKWIEYRWYWRITQLYWVTKVCLIFLCESICYLP